jgi:hypothetical protein
MSLPLLTCSNPDCSQKLQQLDTHQGVLEVVNHTKNGKKADFTPDDVRALNLYLSFAGTVLRLVQK